MKVESMKRSIIILFLLCIFTIDIQAQSTINGYVKGADSQKPLTFATIQIKGTNYGTISNEEGFFRLHANFEKRDSIVFSILGYETKTIVFQSPDELSIIYLKPQVFSLRTFEIKSIDEERVFRELAELLKAYRKNKSRSSAKAYFRLLTVSNEKPIEFVEAFYNGENAVSEGPTSLKLKMGRFGQNKKIKFYSLNTTNQVISLNLFKKNGNTVFPEWCGNLNFRKLSANYKITSVTDYENGYRLKLDPKTSDLFNVEIDINSKSNTIENILLTSFENNLKGYIPIDKRDSLEFGKIEIQVKYYPGKDLINFISMNQEIDYFRAKSQLIHYNTRVDLLMIDYNDLFIDPALYSTVNLTNDYAKILAYGFDNAFWESNNSIAFSKKIDANFDALSLDGDVAFFDGKDISDDLKIVINYPLKPLYTSTQINWDDFSPDSDDLNLNQSYQKQVFNESIRSELYNLEFDFVVNPLTNNDSINYYSKLFFDKSRSYFYLDKKESLLLNIDSIKQRVFLLKNKFDESLPNTSLSDLQLKTKNLDVEIKKLAKQVYLFEPKVDVSKSETIQDTAIVFYNIGLGYQRVKNYEKALHYYEKTIESILERNDVESASENNDLLKNVYYNRAIIWLETDQKSRACEDLYQASLLGDLNAKKKYDEFCDP